MAYNGVLDDLAACVGLREPARTPVFALGLEFDMHMAGLTCADSRTDVERVVKATSDAIATYDYDWAVVFPDDYIEFEPLGLEMAGDPNTPAMPTRYLPMDRQTLARFQMPDADRAMRMPVHLEMIRRTKQVLGDTACVTGRIAAPFSSLALIYGIDALLTTMLLDPGLVQDNTRFFIDHQVAFGKAQFQAGADLLWLGDCVAASNFISLEHFAEFAVEPAAQVATGLLECGGHVVYHAAETSIPYIKLAAQLPVSALNLGEGVSVATVKRELVSRKCLMGNFDPILLRDGSRQQVAEATDKMIRENTPGGGYIFNTGEGIMTNTPPENVAAMMKTAKRVASF